MLSRTSQALAHSLPLTRRCLASPISPLALARGGSRAVTTRTGEGLEEGGWILRHETNGLMKAGSHPVRGKRPARSSSLSCS